MGIKTYQEKNTKSMEKELAQFDVPKTNQKFHISGKWYFRTDGQTVKDTQS